MRWATSHVSAISKLGGYEGGLGLGDGLRIRWVVCLRRDCLSEVGRDSMNERRGHRDRPFISLEYQGGYVCCGESF